MSRRERPPALADFGLARRTRGDASPPARRTPTPPTAPPARAGATRVPRRRPPWPSPLFWRTFGVLALVLATSLAPLAWLLGRERSRHDAQLADATARTVVATARALGALAPAQRAALADALGAQGVSLRMRTMPPTPAGASQAVALSAGDVADDEALARALRRRVGHPVLMAPQLAGQRGPWVAVETGGQSWWVGVERGPREDARAAWFAALALALALAGAATLRLNRPLHQLQFATSRIREGDLDSQLDEDAGSAEVREVNQGFNRMAKTLAKIEHERAVMLAGISHDLRTPLARLRLETELSVADPQAREAMAADIDQLDGIIRMFMDYARPTKAALRPVGLAAVVQRALLPWRESPALAATVRIPSSLTVLADDVELGRVFANLIENALRYGRGASGEVAKVEIGCLHARDGRVRCVVRDHGAGVAPDKLARLTTPFFRGDDARTDARGVGLGLAVVERAMQRMDGRLDLANADDGGLVVTLTLQPAR